ncbi:ArsC/Spx/MgsR family protein [Kushneria indalinina]|uniref:Spx/MgsR family transcriptional regulator n=1 Tax=Kushneria indalinina DSM 14324 TaxID=1122140 RepID=A0A3D9DTL3_9GAMM|nr:ArsC/Spx/MgsR family protein [Kushneria indalinina]REC94072.1 Spx/MgsR family transcriptional regulator [Kushneria indalinina DSM 14324]
MLKLYGLSNCDRCRRARRRLEASDQDVKMIDLRHLADQGELEETLQHFLAYVDWSTLLNRRSTTWRGLDDAERGDLDQTRAMALFKAYPSLIQRPVLDTGAQVLVGRAVDDWSA